MKYNGIELEPITKSQVFNPPKEMLVWDVEDNKPVIKPVCAITGSHCYPVVTNTYCYDCCAEIPEDLKPKRVTNIQLMKWLANGNGVWRNRNERNVRTFIYGDSESLEDEVEDGILIRPFDTTEWLEPTLKNMGMEDK